MSESAQKRNYCMLPGGRSELLNFSKKVVTCDIEGRSFGFFVQHLSIKPQMSLCKPIRMLLGRSGCFPWLSWRRTVLSSWPWNGSWTLNVSRQIMPKLHVSEYLETAPSCVRTSGAVHRRLELLEERSWSREVLISSKILDRPKSERHATPSVETRTLALHNVRFRNN